MKLEVGDMVKVDHPITVLNPTEWFKVTQISITIPDRRVSIRGDETCWFGLNMVIGVRNKHGDEWMRTR